MKHQRGTGNESPIVRLPTTKSTQTQAAEWMAKLDGGDPTDEELIEFSEWVNADTANRQAMDEMIEFWDDINVLTQIVLPREKPNRDRVRVFSLWDWRSAAAAMLVMAVGFWFVPSFQHTGPEIYSTKIGEQKHIQLTDTSTIFLNTNSQVEVSYSDQRREVTLVRGEAHFDVFHQPSRPFEVYAGGGLVRALGTAFSVHISSINIEVIVTEGVVEVDALTEASDQERPTAGQRRNPEKEKTARVGNTDGLGKVRVEAGSMATFDHHQIEEVRLLIEEQIEEKLSWRQGVLVFKNESLQQVVAEVSRYVDLKIVIPERKSRELKVGGIFKVGDTESMFEALREGFNIHAEYVSDELVYLISDENR